MYITSRQRVDEMMVMPYVRDKEGDEWILLSSAVEDRTTSNKGSRASRRDCSISSLHHDTLLDDGQGHSEGLYTQLTSRAPALIRGVDKDGPVMI